MDHTLHPARVSPRVSAYLRVLSILRARTHVLIDYPDCRVELGHCHQSYVTYAQSSRLVHTCVRKSTTFHPRVIVVHLFASINMCVNMLAFTGGFIQVRALKMCGYPANLTGDRDPLPIAGPLLPIEFHGFICSGVLRVEVAVQ